MFDYVCPGKSSSKYSQARWDLAGPVLSYPLLWWQMLQLWCSRQHWTVNNGRQDLKGIVQRYGKYAYLTQSKAPLKLTNSHLISNLLKLTKSIKTTILWFTFWRLPLLPCCLQEVTVTAQEIVHHVMCKTTICCFYTFTLFKTNKITWAIKEL